MNVCSIDGVLPPRWRGLQPGVLPCDMGAETASGHLQPSSVVTRQGVRWTLLKVRPERHLVLTIEQQQRVQVHGRRSHPGGQGSDSTCAHISPSLTSSHRLFSANISCSNRLTGAFGAVLVGDIGRIPPVMAHDSKFLGIM
jgi:hypothetical protein